MYYTSSMVPQKGVLHPWILHGLGYYMGIKIRKTHRILRSPSLPTNLQSSPHIPPSYPMRSIFFHTLPTSGWSSVPNFLFMLSILMLLTRFILGFASSSYHNPFIYHYYCYFLKHRTTFCHTSHLSVYSSLLRPTSGCPGQPRDEEWRNYKPLTGHVFFRCKLYLLACLMSGGQVSVEGRGARTTVICFVGRKGEGCDPGGDCVLGDNIIEWINSEVTRREILMSIFVHSLGLCYVELRADSHNTINSETGEQNRFFDLWNRYKLNYTKRTLKRGSECQ